MTEQHHTQTFLEMPYCLDNPSWQKANMWEPGGPVFKPRTSGVGWTINFANPRSWILMVAIVGYAIWRVS